jgi:DNA-binding transcriptional ArsR family regulator
MPLDHETEAAAARAAADTGETAPAAAARAAGDTGETAPAAASATRELSDPRAMRALAHPVRLSLLDALSIRGPLTATEAGEAIGESPTTCSFHLRQLAKYGFVEEAGRGAGRRRPWRLAHIGLHFTDVHADAGTATAAATLDGVMRERHIGRMRAGMEARARQPREWQEVTGSSQFLLHVTPEELAHLDEEVTKLLTHHRDRLADPASRPVRAVPVEVLLFAYRVDDLSAGA